MEKQLFELFPEVLPEDEVIEVSPDQIEVSDFVNPTPDFVESVRRFGFLQLPIIGKSKGEKKYFAIDGRRRILAAKQIGLKNIKTLYRKGVSRADAMSSVLTLEAQEKRNSNPVASFRAITALIQDGYTKDQISSTLGIAAATIDHLLTYAAVPEDVLDGVVAGKVAVTTVEKMSRLSKPYLDKAVEKYREKGTLTGQQVDEVKDARRSEAAQRIMQQVAKTESVFAAPPAGKNVGVEVTKAAVNHLAELAGLDEESAEMELKTLIGLCKIRSV